MEILHDIRKMCETCNRGVKEKIESAPNGYIVACSESKGMDCAFNITEPFKHWMSKEIFISAEEMII